MPMTTLDDQLAEIQFNDAGLTEAFAH